jgi:hypothetical protein
MATTTDTATATVMPMEMARTANRNSEMGVFPNTHVAVDISNTGLAGFSEGTLFQAVLNGIVSGSGC